MDNILCKRLTPNLEVRMVEKSRMSVFNENEWYFPEKIVIILTVKLNAKS